MNSLQSPEAFAFPCQPDIIPVVSADIPHEYRLRSRYTVPKRYSALPFDLTIPLGFFTDGASAPQYTWSLIGITPDGLWRAAAITHDWLYGVGGNVFAGGVWFKLSRKDCDKVLKRLMLESGCSRFQTWETYMAVRLFGGGHFHEA